VRMNATTVQNVVTYNTIIDFDNPEMKLFPGMTAYITLPVAAAKSVVRVPNGALRYKPDMPADQLRALYKKYGLISGDQSQAASAEGPKGGGASGKQYRARAEGAQGGAGDAGQQRTPRVDVAVIWKLRPDKTLEPVRIRTGITDHTVTEVAQVLNGQLNEGDELVTGAMTATSGTRPPSMGGQTTPRVR
jgi:HlyD family secretion protein